MTGRRLVMQVVRFVLAVSSSVAALGGVVSPLAAQHLLLPMDAVQANHLKAYGVTFSAPPRGAR